MNLKKQSDELKIRMVKEHIVKIENELNKFKSLLQSFQHKFNALNSQLILIKEELNDINSK